VRCCCVAGLLRCRMRCVACGAATLRRSCAAAAAAAALQRYRPAAYTCRDGAESARGCAAAVLLLCGIVVLRHCEAAVLLGSGCSGGSGISPKPASERTCGPPAPSWGAAAQPAAAAAAAASPAPWTSTHRSPPCLRCPAPASHQTLRTGESGQHPPDVGEIAPDVSKSPPDVGHPPPRCRKAPLEVNVPTTAFGGAGQTRRRARVGHCPHSTLA
jgi:hypothetical protein